MRLVVHAVDAVCAGHEYFFADVEAESGGKGELVGRYHSAVGVVN